MYVTVTLSMAILSLMCTMSISGVAKPEQDFGQSNGRMVRVMLVSWVMERVMLVKWVMGVVLIRWINGIMLVSQVMEYCW